MEPKRHFAPFAEVILQNTKSDILFERFCVAHYTNVEGILYVPTSSNYDQKRDARTEWKARASGTSYICASVTDAKRVRAKAKDDLVGLLSHDKHPGKIRLCYTANVTERAKDEILKELQAIAPGIEIELSAFAQISNSIDLFPDAFE